MKILKVQLLLMISFVMFFLGCAEEKKDRTKTEIENIEGEFVINSAKDTIGSEEFAKLSAKLIKPYFADTTSGIMVFLDNSGNNEVHLKSDLSNEFEIDMAIFLNLNFDTINQKWMGNVDYSKTVAFGKKLNTIGKDTIRGYILEYKGNMPPLDNLEIDSGGIKKYYFEKEIIVKQ